MIFLFFLLDSVCWAAKSGEVCAVVLERIEEKATCFESSSGILQILIGCFIHYHAQHRWHLVLNWCFVPFVVKAIAWCRWTQTKQTVVIHPTWIYSQVSTGVTIISKSSLTLKHWYCKNYFVFTNDASVAYESQMISWHSFGQLIIFLHGFLHWKLLCFYDSVPFNHLVPLSEVASSCVCSCLWNDNWKILLKQQCLWWDINKQWGARRVSAQSFVILCVGVNPWSLTNSLRWYDARFRFITMTSLQTCRLLEIPAPLGNDIMNTKVRMCQVKEQCSLCIAD